MDRGGGPGARHPLQSPMGKRKRERDVATPSKPSDVPAETSVPAKAALADRRAPKGPRGLALVTAVGGKSCPASDSKISNSQHISVSVAPRSVSRQLTTTTADPLLKQPLPKHLAILSDMFNALQTVYEVMRKRGLRTTFDAMKNPIEDACGKRFTTTHLAQLQAMLPDNILLEWIRIPLGPTKASTTRMEPALLITLVRSQPGLELASLRDELHCKLAAHLLDAYSDHIDRQISDKLADGDQAAADELLATPRKPPLTDFVSPYPDGAPHITGAILPPRPTTNKDTPLHSASPLILGDKRNQYLTASTPAEQGDRTGLPPLPPGAALRRGKLHQRRLSFSVAASSVPPKVLSAPSSQHQKKNKKQTNEDIVEGDEEGVEEEENVLAASDTSTEAPTTEATTSQEEQQLLASMPEELRRRSIDGIISLDTLRALEANEVEHTLLSGAEAKAARERGAALAALPRMFARLQRIFGSKGPNAIKMGELVQRIRQGGAEMTTDADVETQLEAVAEYAPEFLQLKPWGACGTPAVWINRRCDKNLVTKKLKEVAETRYDVSAAAGNV